MQPYLANIAVDLLLKGGPIMWPILACLLAAVAVVLERGLWWFDQSRRHSRPRIEDAFEALSDGRFSEAYRTVADSDESHLITIRSGIEHAHASMLGAMQLRASELLEEAEKRLWVLSTFITLAPLLGLMGTVIGIMHSFSFVGDSDLAATKVSGGIAEALIATACGLGIAILCLLPYNYFNRLLSLQRSRLERTINHVELLVESARHHGHDLEQFSRKLPVNTSRRDRDTERSESLASLSGIANP